MRGNHSKVLRMNNRRNWLKQVGLGIAGLGLSSFDSVSFDENFNLQHAFDEDTIFLSSNENPYGPSPMAKNAMIESLSKSNRYGMEITMQLARALAEKNQVSSDNIIMSPGSSAILDIVARFAGMQKGNFVTAEPTFNYWGSVAEALGLKKIDVGLTDDKKHNLDTMLKAITSETRLVYVCNPNNPTGTICEHEELKSFIEKASQNALVLLDEAYLEFTDEKSMTAMVKTNKNLIIAKTFSKIYGLAGARIGYALAHSDTIKKLKQLQTWAGIALSVVSSSAALASLNDNTFIDSTRNFNKDARTYAITELERIGIPCIPSYTNFIYFSLKDYEKDFFQQLKAANIIGTRIYETEGEWSRITVGTMNEMKALSKALG